MEEDLLQELRKISFASFVFHCLPPSRDHGASSPALYVLKAFCFCRLTIIINLPYFTRS